MPELPIPHRPPLRLARRLIARADDASVVECVVATDSPAAHDGRIRPGYLVECAAQSAAALRNGDEAHPRAGRLVGVSDWHTIAEAAADTPLQVHLRPAGSFGPLAAFDVELLQDHRVIATGRLQVHRR